MVFAVIILLVAGVAVGQETCGVIDHSGYYVRVSVGSYVFTDDKYLVRCYDGGVMRRIDCLNDNYELSINWVSQLYIRMKCRLHYAIENNTRVVVHAERKIVGCELNGKSVRPNAYMCERGYSGVGLCRKCQAVIKSDSAGKPTIAGLTMPYVGCVVFADMDAPEACKTHMESHKECYGVRDWVRPDCVTQLTNKRIFECIRGPDGSMHWRTRNGTYQTYVDIRQKKYPLCAPEWPLPV